MIHPHSFPITILALSELDILTAVRKTARRLSLVLLMLLIVFVVAADNLNLNPLQRAAMQYRYSLTAWEVQNLPDKWLYKLTTLLPWNAETEAERQDDVLRYFVLGEELGVAVHSLNRAIFDPATNGVAALQAEVDEILGARESLRNGVEETIESAISTAFYETGLGWWDEIVFPPVDIRLAGPPTLLLSSPRDHIERQHEVLLEPDISLLDRERLENQLMVEDETVSVASFKIGGLATYPASVVDTASLEDTLRTAAHEWTHHYMVFHPFGQKMFTSSEMVTLNETFADIVGRELGNRARVVLFNETDDLALPVIASSPLPSENGVGDGDTEFDFNAEMRQTRLRVDDLLTEGKISEAEKYMEERRQIFIENGHYIRKLNQAYFAFHGTYAESAASSSPIGGQLHDFRDLLPDLRTFITEMSKISSYQQFLERLTSLKQGKA